jgi:serine phosphatase RsbU (regulator of sigma subunit)/putative methionine-R-sulfoxide reductase with GAF domain
VVQPHPQRDIVQAFADVARALQAERTAGQTLQKIVDLARRTIEGCDHAGISLVVGQRIETPAASDPVPSAVDEIQYQAGEGPCLDAIRHHEVFATDDLAEEQRWPHFSGRAVAETGVRSMMSFRLFLEQDTIGALNLYSTKPRAFDADSQATGGVLAAHGAVALASAREHDRAERLQHDLASSEDSVRAYEQQVQVAATLQRSMLPALPDLGEFELAARYAPATEAAEVGGDWYDVFTLPEGVPALVIGDVAGHDIEAAVRMGQLRNLLRALAVDRGEPPGDLLRRLDRVATHLNVTNTATCIYGLLETSNDGAARLRFANAGHPPPLLVTADGAARYVETSDHTLLGLGLDLRRSTNAVDLPVDSTLLFYTDGLVEHPGRGIHKGLSRLREVAATLATQPVEHVCDALIDQLANQPGDDVCLLAVRTRDADR